MRSIIESRSIVLCVNCIYPHGISCGPQVRERVCMFEGYVKIRPKILHNRDIIEYMLDEISLELAQEP